MNEINQKFNMTKKVPGAFFIVIALCLGILRWYFPERSMDQAGPAVMLDTLFALGLWVEILVLGVSIGRRVLSIFIKTTFTPLERALFETSIGVGMIAYGVLALGLLGLLTSTAILFWIGILFFFSWPTWFLVSEEWWAAIKRAKDGWVNAPIWQKGILILGAVMVGLTFFSTLTPITDYDSLYYHMVGPKLFLQAEKIGFIEEVWQANYPFTIQMVYTLGLAFHSEPFARLINFSYSLALVISTFAFGHRFFSHREAWLSIVLIAGIPVFPLWASYANCDTGWALYEFLAVYAACIWWVEGTKRLLLLAGILTGLALGTKYLAIGTVIQVGLLLLFKIRELDWRNWARQVFTYSFVAALVASPWYLKNLLLTSNPFYPLFFGGPGWDTERIFLFNTFHFSFGVEKTFWNLLTLPIQIFIQHTKFITSFSNEFLNVFFLLSLLYPVFRKTRSVIHYFAILTLVRFAFWALGTQQIRLMLPLFPAFALLSAYVIFSIIEKVTFKRFAYVIMIALTSGVMVSTIAYQVIYFVKERPIHVIFGMETKRSFLLRNNPIFPALDYIQTYLPGTARVKILWNGQGYYCDERCDVDNDQMEWVYLVRKYPIALDLKNELCASGVSHLLVAGDLQWFLLFHDPIYVVQSSFEFLYNDFKPYIQQEKDFEYSVLFSLRCHGSTFSN